MSSPYTHIHLCTRSKQAPFFAHTRNFRTHFLNNSNSLLGSPSSSRLSGTEPITTRWPLPTSGPEADFFPPERQRRRRRRWHQQNRTRSTQSTLQIRVKSRVFGSPNARRRRRLHALSSSSSCSLSCSLWWGKPPTELTGARDSCGARIDTKLTTTLSGPAVSYPDWITLTG